MTFSKYNNPSKKRKHHKMSRGEADIVVGKMMLDNLKEGRKMSLNVYDKISDKLCDKPSRHIYD